MPESDKPSLQFTLDWRASLLALMLLPLLMSLGFWQLDRAEEKRQLQSMFQLRQEAGPKPIEQLSGGDLHYQPVSLRGEFNNDKTMLLDNRIYQRRFGYEIITPFKLAGSEQWVLVNRGWLRGDSARRSLPDIASISGEVELQAEVYVPQGTMMQLAEDNASGWPRVVQSIDVEAVSAELGLPFFPYVVRLREYSIAAFQPSWVVVNIQPEKHTAYAVQWFAMSATLLVIGFLANTNFWALLKRR